MSMAMKYAMQKRANKGGCSGPGCAGCGDAMCMAEGGDTSGTPGGVHADISRKEWGGGARQGTSLAGEHVRGAKMAHDAGHHKAEAARMGSAKNLHREALDKLKGDKTDRKYLAEGGEVDDGSDGIVDRIMKRFAKGGEVEPVADFESNDFEVEPTGDDFSETGANSGDELGDEAEDDDRDDIVSRVMKSRGKKDKMPRPA